MRSEFLGIEIDLEELSAVIAAAVGRKFALTPLAVKCTYPVFRGEAADGSAAFVKIGTAEEWRRTVALLKDLGGCGLFAPMLTEQPIDYRGHAVFISEWREARTVFPEDFTDAQLAGFARGCERLSAALQGARDFQRISESPNSPGRLFAIVSDYARRHPVAGRLLKSLLAIPAAARTYDGHSRVVIHGDFHAKNFGFIGDELASVYDFDKLSEGLACGDLVNALVERFSCLGLSRAARRRLAEVTRRIAVASHWSQDELVIAANVLRLGFAARRIEKHPGSAWVALDILRRDRKIREILPCLQKASDNMV